MKDKVVFESINPDYFKTYLILENKDNSMNGLLISSELNMDNIPVYYIAELKDLTKNNKNISFSLQNVQFSEKEIDYNTYVISPISSSTKIPLLLQYNLYFNIMIHGDKVEAKRFSALYDSHFDEIIFSKIK